MSKWSKLCNANLNHYNNHKTAHNTITAVYGVAAVVVVNVVARKLAK